MTGDDENSLPYRLFLTDRQVITPYKVFANKSSASIKLKKNTASQNNGIETTPW